MVLLIHIFTRDHYFIVEVKQNNICFILLESIKHQTYTSFEVRIASKSSGVIGFSM